MINSAGIVIIKDKKILLCHPTNTKWDGTYTFPKGHIEHCETKIKAAIRETSEEVGILIPDTFIIDNVKVIEYKDKNGNIYKKVFYYVIEMFDLPDVLPQSQLQSEEIDWAGFLDYETAQKKIFWRFKPILEIIK